MNLTQEDIQSIAKILQATPTQVELQIFDTMWSEHCSYKSSRRVLKGLPTEGKNVALGIGEDSGIVRFVKHNGRSYCLAVSHESHNHPSQILPVEGAATGVGGVVRDVYCMGADVIGVLNSLHFGDQVDGPSIVKDIKERVILGVSDYANPLGVPVLGGETVYHPSYNENCLVNVAAIGLVEENEIIHSYAPARAKDEPYDVILIGKSTDSSGFGGASFSSQTLDSDDDATNLGAVQLHDPFMKRVIVEAIKQMFKEIREHNIEVGFKDLGAGGIACAASEIAASGGFGVDIDLSKVLCGVEGLPPEVVSCSETQERFCIVVPRHFSQRCCDIFNKDFELGKFYPNAGASIIGEVKNDPFFRLFHDGNVVGNIPISAITTDVSVHRESIKKSIDITTEPGPEVAENMTAVCVDMLSHSNNESKKAVFRHFDQGVRGDTVMGPGEGDAVIVTPVEGSKAGVVSSMDSNLYGKHCAYTAGAYAVAEGVRNIVAVGGKPLAATDCLNYGNPENPHVFYQFEQGIAGIRDACNALNVDDDDAIPIISGNVSFYNESKSGSEVVPSPVIATIGKIENSEQCVHMQIFEPNMHLYLVGERYEEYGGTQISNVFQGLNNNPPNVRFEDEKKANRAVASAIQNGFVEACHDVSMGGVLIAVVEMLCGRNQQMTIGAKITIDQANAMSFLFSENGGYILAVSDANKARFETLMNQSSVQARCIGQSTSDPILEFRHKEKPIVMLDSATIQENWATI